VFAGMSAYDCDADGDLLPGTGRPWLGALDLGSGAMVWEHEVELAGSGLEGTHDVAALESSVVAVESVFEGVSRLRGVDRTGGADQWSIESTAEAFRRVAALDGGSFVAGLTEVEDLVPMLRLYDATGEEMGTWIIQRSFGELAPLDAAADGSVLHAGVTFDDRPPSVERYQLPL